MGTAKRTTTGGGRPGVRREAKRTDHRGRPYPAPTGTAPVRPSGVAGRRFDVAGPVVTYDDPHAGREHVNVRPFRGDIEPAGPDIEPGRNVWRSADRRDDTAPAHPYGRGRSRGVGAAARARVERRRDAAAAASRREAFRIRERMRTAADPEAAWTGATDRQRRTGRAAPDVPVRVRAAADMREAARAAFDATPRARRARSERKG